jgi:phosphohistidine phosphatase SixA
MDERALGQFGPVTALVSGAARTRQTFRRAFEETPLVASSYESDLIYNGRRDVTAEDLLIELAALDPVSTSLLVVGHNPTMTELLWRLTGSLPMSARDGAPLASCYVLRLHDDVPVGLATYELVSAFIPD